MIRNLAMNGDYTRRIVLHDIATGFLNSIFSLMHRELTRKIARFIRKRKN